MKKSLSKKGVSTIVATVLIVLVTIAGASIVGVSVYNLVSENSSQEIPSLFIENSEGYTFWDEENKTMCVQIGRGDDDADFEKLQIIFDNTDGNSKTFLVPYTNEQGVIPQINEKKVYCFNSLNEIPSSVKIAAVFSSGKVSEILDSLDLIKSGNVVGEIKLFDEYGEELKNHPILLFTAEELEEIKIRAEDETINELGFSYKQSADEVIRVGEVYYNADFPTWNTYVEKSDYCSKYTYVYNFSSQTPPRHSSCIYPFFTGITNIISTRIISLSLAYSLTGEEKYAEKAKAYLLDISDWDYWYDPDWSSYPQTPGASCLSDGYLTRASAIGYDLIYDYLTPEEREKIRNATIEKGIKIIEKNINPGWPNGFFLKLGGLGLASLAFKDEINTSSWLNKAISNANIGISLGGEDGDLCETYGYGTLFQFEQEFIKALYNSGNPEALEMINSQFFSNLPNFLVSTQSSFKSYPNFGDSSVSTNLASFKRTLLWYLAVNHPKKAEALWAINHSGTNIKNIDYTLFWFDSSVVPTAVNANSAQFKTAAITILRKNSWSNSDPILAFKSSQTCTSSHQHYDANSFILGMDKWLLTDPGYVSATDKNYMLSTKSHNSILVDDIGQNNKKGGIVEEFFTSDNLDYVIGEAKDSYPTNLLNKFQRNIIFIKQENPFFIIYDELESASPRSYTLFYHTNSPNMEIDSDGFNINDYPYNLKGKVFSSQQISENIVPTPQYNFEKFRYEGKTTTKKNNEHFISLLFPYESRSELYFENSYDIGFLSYGGGVLSYSNDCSESFEGDCSLLVEDKEDSGSTSVFDSKNFIKVDKDKDYLLSVAVKSEDGTQKCYAGLQYFYENKTRIKYDYPALYSKFPSTSWKNYEATIGHSSNFKFPEGTAYVKVYILGSYRETQGKTWWDNIIFKEIGEEMDKPTITTPDNNIINIFYKDETKIILFNKEKTSKVFETEHGTFQSDALFCIINSEGSVVSYKGNCSKI